ncbi:MAG: MBOAT family protein [Clostridiales bacterium]|nr:MBOAT family protein [Clostridiales bacterium]
MYFSSLIFLFVYLPAVLMIYYLIPSKARNAFLLFVNLIFYGWGEPVFILIMLLSVTVNYIFGYLIEKNRENERLAKAFVLFSVIISLGLLGIFKYTNFINGLLRQISLFAALPKTNIPLPIGISFYTFQAMSYTIDVYRKDTKAQKSIISFGTYVSFFPQLIAGPIVRYKDIARQLEERHENIGQFASGVRRFVTGLAKKVLIANQMGLLWDTLRPMGADNGVIGAWIGIIAYAMQIYFDFSAYSDMAIGLGRMFGFEFMENFNYPYISKSITEFWRRWHISLGTWFRDYVYIPLGGNRCSMPRHIFNLFVVWALTGFWHGASINFVLWGIYFFVLLVLEKFVYGKPLAKAPAPIQHIYALFFIVMGWALFYFEDFSEMGVYISYMFGGAKGILGADAASVILGYMPLMLFSAVICTPITQVIYRRMKKPGFRAAAELGLCALLLVICTAALVSQSYNPFLYFRF